MYGDIIRVLEREVLVHVGKSLAVASGHHLTTIISELKMANMDSSYNLAAIRRLLLEAFGPDTLRRFCQDRPLFRPILDDFGPGHSLNDMVDRVVDYCESQALIDQLLAAVQQSSPGQYARFEGHLHDSSSLSERKSGSPLH